MKQKFSKPDFDLAKKFGKALKKYGMLIDGETIAVGMSGGKDSYTLLDLFYRRRRDFPIDYKLVAVHIDFGLSENQSKKIRQFCLERNIECFIEKQELVIEEGREVNCFYCSWMRRTYLFQFVHRLGIKKLAFGHHLNDCVETIFLNMFYQSKFESFLPKTTFFNGEFDLIRPLVLCSDKNIRAYADRNNLPYEGHKCPFGLLGERNSMREMIKKLEEKDERIVYNVFNSFMKEKEKL